MSASTASPRKRQTELRAWLENEISEGNLRPGDRLDEAEICRKFGVSRTPVREAFLQLASLRLVVLRKRHGAEIARLSAKQIAAMLEVLAKLEGHCAQLAARRMSLDEREALRAILDSAEPAIAANNVAAYDEANRQFHEAIYTGSKNDFLAGQVRDIRRRLRVYRRDPFKRPGGMERSYRGHKLVVEAILAGEVDGAESAMHEHVIGAVGFMDLLADLPDEADQGEDSVDDAGFAAERPRPRRPVKRAKAPVAASRRKGVATH